jgi:hypothetical protein
MDTTPILTALAAGSILGIGLSIAYYRRVWTPIIFLVVGHFMGNWSHTLLHTLDIARALPYRFHTTGSDANIAMLEFNLVGLIGLVLGHLLGSRFARDRPSARPVRVLNANVLEGTAVLFTIYAAILAVFFSRQLPLNAGYYTEALVKFRGFYTIAVVRGLILPVALICRFHRKDRIPLVRYLVIFAVEIPISLKTGDRDQLALLLVGCSMVYLYYQRSMIRSLALTGNIVVVGSLLNIAIEVSRRLLASWDPTSIQQRLSYGLRGVEEKGVGGAVVRTLTAVSSEHVQSWFANHWFFTNPNRPLHFGRTYLYALINVFVPRFLQGQLVYWQPTILFKQIAYPDVESIGFEFAFSAEAALNFGLWGGVVSFVAVGFAAGLSYSKFSHHNSFWGAVFSLLIPINYTRWVRSDSTSIFRMLSMILGLYWVLTKVFHKRMQPVHQESDM